MHVKKLSPCHGSYPIKGHLLRDYIVINPFWRDINSFQTYLSKVNVLSLYQACYGHGFMRHCFMRQLRNKHVSVASVLGATQTNVDFQKTLLGHHREAWNASLTVTNVDVVMCFRLLRIV